MTTSQPGIFALGSRSHHHLEFDLAPGHDITEVIEGLQQLHEPHVTGGATNLVLGFGAEVWLALHPDGPSPAGLGAFTDVGRPDGPQALATQHDVWAWIHGSGTDEVLDSARSVRAALAPVADLVEECVCFVYHDSRDLTGFIDGTANPSPAAAPAVALIPAGHPGAGGSHVLAQRWVHDLESFDALEVTEQERVIGRTKLDSTALDATIRPPDSHISLAEVHDADGNERPIYRRSTPFGTATEQGLYFLAFSAERDRFDAMFTSMFGASDADPTDRILAFSSAVSSSYYFAPSLDDLLELGITAG